MKVSVATIGTFHIFDLAVQLQNQRLLGDVFTGYPKFKLSKWGLPESKLKTFPWLHTIFMANAGRNFIPATLIGHFDRADRVSFDNFCARNLSETDVFVAMSGSCLNAGRRAKTKGAKFVCDRGSSHILTQQELLLEESRRWGVSEGKIDPWVIAREMDEYSEADYITVPSTFALESFVDQGVSPKKLRMLAYGVDVQRFKPSASPDQDSFDILFAGSMGLRKGVPYLLKAFQELSHPKKSLTFAGGFSTAFVERMKHIGLWSEKIKLLGHIPQDRLATTMSKSHVMVLPSIEDGFGLVIAQAMACGCPVIATHNTGARDLYEHGRHGFVIPPADTESLTATLQKLADDRDLAAELRSKALKHVSDTASWEKYGRNAASVYRDITS